LHIAKETNVLERVVDALFHTQTSETRPFGGHKDLVATVLTDSFTCFNLIAVGLSRIYIDLTR
jgi:hypothetical protein